MKLPLTSRLPFAGRGRPRLMSDETFLRGLTLGALIGAAIAGSTLWSRLRRPSPSAVEDPAARDTPPG
jgi:hypothetical protein